MTVQVVYRCNDDRGEHVGRIDAISFEDQAGHRASLAGPSVRLVDRTDVRYIRVRGAHFNTLGLSIRWVGNIYWDGVPMVESEAVRLLEFLLERGYAAEDWTTDGPFAAPIERALRGTP